MDTSIAYIVDIFFNMNNHLNDLIEYFGVWTYVILFLVIFCETGLVVTPFLPGDSLIFIVGAFAANGQIDIWIIGAALISAGVLGNLVNYQIGRFIGPKIFHAPRLRFIKHEYLVKTHDFYEKHGGKAVVIARFMPIFRTFVPFIAGIAQMNYRRFFLYNLVGSSMWVLIFLLGGYLFGNIPVVEQNLSLVIIAVILISLMPGFIAGMIEKRKKAHTNKVLP